MMSDAMRETAEQAYGLLWCDGGESDGSNQARKLLMAAIGKDGQKRGIEHALATKRNPYNSPVTVTGIHLLRLGDYVVVNAEIGGRWVEVIREHHDGSFSHIVEPGGMRGAYMRALTDSLFERT